MRPLTIEAVRDVVGKHGPYDLYRVREDVLQNEMLEHLRFESTGLIYYEKIVIREVELPEKLNYAITHKLTQEQNAEAYEYILEQARKEAERQRIKAIGIQTFYSIVANSLTPQLLTWRGIEATVQLAHSNNTKVIVVGSGKDQLPLILGSDIANQPKSAPPPPISPNAYPMPQLNDLPNMFPSAAPEGSSARDGAAAGAFGGAASPEPAESRDDQIAPTPDKLGQ